MWKIDFSDALQYLFLASDLIDCSDGFSEEVNLTIFNYLFAVPKVGGQ